MEMEDNVTLAHLCELVLADFQETMMCRKSVCLVVKWLLKISRLNCQPSMVK